MSHFPSCLSLVSRPRHCWSHGMPRPSIFEFLITSQVEFKVFAVISHHIIELLHFVLWPSLLFDDSAAKHSNTHYKGFQCIAS